MCSKIVPYISHLFKYSHDPYEATTYSGLTTKLFHIEFLAFSNTFQTSKHTVQEVCKVASKNNAHTQFWSQYSFVRSTHSLPAKDVDGSLVTGASQDHFVGFHHLTILTGQGDIKEFLVKGSLAVKKCSFFEHCSKSLWPPPPLSFEHYVMNFSEGILAKVRKHLSRQLLTK